MELNTADVLIISTILISTVIGIYRGFLRELLTVMVWLIAAVLAYIYGKAMGDYLVFFENAAVKEALGMFIVFIAVVLVGMVVKIIVAKAGKIPGITTIDRIIGALFGVIRGCVLVVLVLLVSSNNIEKQDWYKKSILLPRFAKAADATSKATPESWKEDYRRAVSEFAQAQQCPAPVVKAVPVATETVTIQPVQVDLIEEKVVVPATAPASGASIAPAATPASTTTNNVAPASTPTQTPQNNTSTPASKTNAPAAKTKNGKN